MRIFIWAGLLCAAMLAAAQDQAPAALSFDAPRAYYTGGSGDYYTGGTGMVAADFNGDGLLDLATSDGTTPGVYQLSVFLGAKGGAFQPPLHYSIPAAVAMAAGDFNRDGKLDLVVVGGARAAILLGNGDGTFQPAKNVFAGSWLVSVAVGDFNGDGNPDLVVANNQANTVSVVLGNGNGTFGPATVFPCGKSPESVTVGDFNQDGNLDVAVATGNKRGQAGTIAVLLGTGSGSFEPAVDYLSGNFRAVIASDLDGDGILDLAAVKDSNTNMGVAAILRGRGDGTFASAADYEVASGPQSLVTGDFNGDGKLDLAVSSGTVLLGHGDLTFTPAAQTFEPQGGQLAAGDFNRDGRLDLATVTTHFSCCSYFGVVYVFIGHNNGTFSLPAVTPLASQPVSMAAADLNGDGKLDVAITNQSNVQVLLGNSDGTFQTPINVNAGIYTNAVAAADFNGDGKLDLAVTNSGLYSNEPANTVSILLGNGDGTFQPPVAYTVGTFPVSVQVTDFNGDGKPDLLVYAVVDPSPTFSVLLGRGDGTFQSALNYATSQTGSAIAGDFNGDGKPDVALAVCGNTPPFGVAIRLGNGDGTFQAPVLSQTPICPGTLYAADLNHDGKLDVVGVTPESDFLYVLLGNGDGSLQAPLTLPFSSQGLAISDFNGDGKLDLAIYDGFIGVALGNGDGTFQSPLYYAGQYGLPLAGDFYQGPHPDLAVAILSPYYGVAILHNTTR